MKTMNFTVKVCGYSQEMNNVNKVAEYAKDVLLNTNNVVNVNGFKFYIGGAEGAEGFTLYVGKNIDDKAYVYKAYHLGKIRRGVDRYVADFLELNAEYDMYNVPMFVWENGKMVAYKKVNEVEDNEGMDKDIVHELNEGFKDNSEVTEITEDKKIYTCADALNELNSIIDFVEKSGVKMTIEEVFNIVDRLNVIKSKMNENDNFDYKIKENFWYWCSEFKGLKNLLYDLKSNLYNLKDGLE